MELHTLLAMCKIACSLLLASGLLVAGQGSVDPLTAPVKVSTPKECVAITDQDLSYKTAVQDLYAAVEDETVLAPSCLDTSVFNSCKEILERCGPKPSGYYWLMSGFGTPVQAYCNMEGTNCGGEGGWMLVYQLNMTNASHQCPDRWDEEINSDRRGCYRSGSGCRPAVFDANLIPFNQVCGQARGYQYGTLEGFFPYRASQPTADGRYLDGLSLTYSNPRKHIWAFIGSWSEDRNDSYSCPCKEGSYAWIPAYVKDDYYCESGSPTDTQIDTMYPDDELWDGEQCGAEADCCTNPLMPYFVKTLPETYVGAIEGRLCTNEGPINERANVHYLELWVR